MKITFSSSWSFLRDCFWPSLDTVSQGNKKLEISLPGFSPADIAREALDSLQKMVSAEEERRKSADMRLQAFLPTSIGVVAFVIALMGFISNFFAFSNVATHTCYILSAYILVQMIRLALAAITGLTPKSYSIYRPLIPESKENLEKYNLRHYKELALTVYENMEVTNTKLSQVNVGHRAMQNALVAMLLLIPILVTDGFLNPSVPRKRDPLIGINSEIKQIASDLKEGQYKILTAISSVDSQQPRVINTPSGPKHRSK